MALALWNKISQAGIQVVPDANFVDDDEVVDDGFYTYNDYAGDILEEKAIKEQQPKEPSDYWCHDGRPYVSPRPKQPGHGIENTEIRQKHSFKTVNY